MTIEATMPQRPARSDDAEVDRRLDAVRVRAWSARAGRTRLSQGLGGDAGSLVLLAPSRGTVTVASRGSMQLLEHGDVLVAQADRVLGGRLSADAEVTVLSVPGSVADRAGLDVADVRVLRATQPRAGLLAATMHALVDLRVAEDSFGLVRLVDHLLGIVAWGVDADDGGRGGLVQRALDEIDRRLDDADLSPATLAAALHVSTRTLHRSFDGSGASASTWIRKRRLERCRTELADPRFAERTVSAIGARWGLADAAHLSRSFKEEYGLSPRAFRAEHLRHACAGRCDD